MVKQGNSKEMLKQLDSSFDACKSALLTRVLPSCDDPQVTVKVIQVLALFKDKLAKDSHNIVVNNMHHGAAPIREEAANFLLQTNADFSNGLKDLLPIQKTTEEDTDFAPNFFVEPNTSRK